jgi:hypothetical protein
VFETIASVIELAGRATVPVTLIFPAFKLAMLEDEMVVVLNELVPVNVFEPLNVLLPLRYARLVVSDKLVEAMPVTDEPVKASVPVTVKLPTFADAMLEVTNVVELVNKNCPDALNVLPESDRYGVPVTEFTLLYTVKYPLVEVPTLPLPPLPQPVQLVTVRLVK